MYRHDRRPLFTEGDLHSFLQNKRGQVKDRVSEVEKSQLLHTSPETLTEYIEAQLHVEPLKIYQDRMEMDPTEISIDVSDDPRRAGYGLGRPMIAPGVRTTVSIPFTGDPELWRLRPNSFSSMFPYGEVRLNSRSGQNHLEVHVEQPSDVGTDTTVDQIRRQIDLIEKYISWQQNEIERFNNEIESIALREVEARRSRIRNHDGIAEKLGIPLKRKDGAPEIRPINMKRKLVRPLPAAPKEGFAPEPGINPEEYEHILNVIRHEGLTFEATPKTYAVHGEEELRDIILAHLNGHYEGGATGETFRRKGKTDIRIEDDSRAAFVGECKVWTGPKALLSACDQLTGYLTWRDCKSALIIFNKRVAKFTKLLQAVPSTIRQYPQLKREIEVSKQGEWRYVFAHDTDEAREITVHVFLFNLYYKA